MNIKMDRRAKAYLRATQPLPSQRFTHGGWSLTIKGRLLSRYPKDEIYKLIHQSDIRVYWQKKHDLTEEDMETINWSASKKALKAMPRGQRWFHAKFSTGHCAVGRMMLLRKEWNHSRCPGCSADIETTRHVLQCPSE